MYTVHEKMQLYIMGFVYIFLGIVLSTSLQGEPYNLVYFAIHIIGGMILIEFTMKMISKILPKN